MNTAVCLFLISSALIPVPTIGHDVTTPAESDSGQFELRLLGGVVSKLSQKLDSLKSLVTSLLSGASGGIIQPCKLPRFTLGCTSGTVCATRRPGRNVCEPQRDDGTFCETGDQCKSGECRNYYCASDRCPQAGQPSKCGFGLTCTATLRGNRCQPLSPSVLASLPQDDPEQVRLQREDDLQLKRQVYQYVQNLPGGPVGVKDLPPEEAFSAEYLQGLRAAVTLTTSQGLPLMQMTEPWESAEQLADTQNRLFGETAEARLIQRNWATDRWFGLQRVQGLNPRLITLCREIPPKLAVTPEMLTPQLEGMTPSQALANNRLFIIDLEILTGCPLPPGEFLATPIALFYLNRQDQLLPIAIQLFQQPAPDNPVFTPSDQNVWLAAKMFYNIAEAHHHQAITHFTHTHFLLEGTAVAMHRQLSTKHPVFRLLAPHYLYLMAINSGGNFLAPGGNADDTYCAGGPGFRYLFQRSSQRFRLDEVWDIPQDLANRGVLDRNALPYYPFRDDALEIYAVVRRYVYQVLAVHYTDEGRLADDSELQAWRRELSRNIADGGVGLRGVPGSQTAGLRTLAELVDLCTWIISASSLAHAAVNFGQFERYVFTPNYPVCLVGAPPTSKANINDAQLAAMFTRGPKMQLVAVATTKLTYQGTQPLGEFETRYVYEPEGSVAAVRLRADLRRISRRVQERNARAEFPYTWLDPARVPNSVAI